MEIKRFGNIEGKTMMLLHGNLMCWRQFEDLIPLLERKFCVYAVSFDGFDGTGETTYTTARDQADKLARRLNFLRALITAGLLPISPKKPVLPSVITSYSILSLGTSSLIAASEIASSTVFALTSIYSMRVIPQINRHADSAYAHIRIWTSYPPLHCSYQPSCCSFLRHWKIHSSSLPLHLHCLCLH